MKKESKYIQLFETIRAEISRGVYKNGERIPGENELSKKYGMSRQTVRQSLSLLEQKGLVERKQGSGTYVIESIPKRKKTWEIGVIATYISEYIFPSILRGIEGELSNAGFLPVINATKNRVDSERSILEEYLRRPIDGLIIEATKSALPNPNVGLYEDLIRQGTPVVFFNSYYPVMQNPTYVIMNDKMGGHMAASYLVERGHQKIGGIFKSDAQQGLDRCAGYLDALLEKGLPIKDEWTIWFNSENRTHLMGQETDRILQSLKECSAVICYNDEIAVKLVNVLAAAGYKIPQDKAVISFDNSLLSEVSQVPITSLDHPKDLLGAVAARKLVGMVDGKKEKSTIMEWNIVQKEST